MLSVAVGSSPHLEEPMKKLADECARESLNWTFVVL